MEITRNFADPVPVTDPEMIKDYQEVLRGVLRGLGKEGEVDVSKVTFATQDIGLKRMREEWH